MNFNKRKTDRRKPDARPIAASAEVCETRALLSADGAAVTIEELVDTNSEETDTVDAVGEDEQFVLENDIFTIFVGADEADAIDGEELLYTCGLTVDEEIVDALPVDEFIGEEEFVDVTTLEDWDPSWAYRSFGVAEESDEGTGDGEVVAVEVSLDETEGGEEVVDVTTLEDWDPSWAYRGVVVDEAFTVTDDSEGGTDEITDENVIFTMGVQEKDLEGDDASSEFEFDGEVVVEDSGELVTVADGEVKDSEEVVEEVDVESGSEELLEAELNDLIRFNVAPNFRGNSGTEPLMASAAGGVPTEFPQAPVPSVMGPIASGGSVAVAVSVPIASTPVSLPTVSQAPVAIPVSASSFPSLFEAGQDNDILGIGTLIAQLPEDSSVSSELTEVVEGSGLESGLGQTESESLSSLDSGLEVLDTLLEQESTESDSETPSEPSEVEVAPEETVTSTNVTAQGSAPAVVTAARPAYYSSERLTDRFMTEFSVNGFVG